MMKNYTLYLGLVDKHSGLQEIATLEAFKVVENIRKAMFARGETFQVERVNKLDGGTFSTKEQLRIEIPNAEKTDIQQFADILKLAFNQENILVEEAEVTWEQKI